MLLAAGAGRRAGGPKALRRDPDGTWWLLRALDALRSGGCPAVVLVLGAGAAEARGILHAAGLGETDRLLAVEAADWASGMAASLRTGLAAVAARGADAALVHLVDLPDVGPPVVRRVIQRGFTGRLSLARASYDGEAGHPVLIGADHLGALLPTLSGDEGGRRFLSAHPVHGVECGDLAHGRDRDHPR